MYLADDEIRARLTELDFSTDVHHDFDPDQQIQPCSVDLRLSEVFWRPTRASKLMTVDLARSKLLEVNPRRNWKRVILGPGETILLRPGQMILARIYERFTIPSDCAGRIEGRSSFSRMGLSVHCTGSFINPGWRGHMPLVLINHSPFRLRIPAHLPICQLMLVSLAGKPSHLYGEDTLRNKYMDDDGGPSYWWRDKVVEKLLDGLGQPDLQHRVQDRLLERIGVPSDEVLARMEYLVSSRPAGSYGNADDLLEDFVRLEDRKRMMDSILRWSGKSALPILVGASIGSLFVHPIGVLHLTLWILTALAIPAAYAAFISSGEYLGERELKAIDQRRRMNA